MEMKDKIPFYNIVNMFFVGSIFSLCLTILLREYIPLDWIKENADLLSDWSILISAVLLIAMYELGFIINKMGSVFIEPIYRGKKFKKFKIWPKEDYGIDVSQIEQINPRFQSMVTELILMRSHIMMCLILLVVTILRCEWIWSVVLVLLIVLFTLGGRKHNEKINIIRKDYAQEKNRNKQYSQSIKEYIGNK